MLTCLCARYLQGLLDSEEYSLWAAFMKPDSPPLSPSPSPGTQGFSVESLDKAGGGRDGGAGSGEGGKKRESGRAHWLIDAESKKVATGPRNLPPSNAVLVLYESAAENTAFAPVGKDVCMSAL